MSKILFADDDPAMRQMVADVLTAAGHELRLADGGPAARAEIQRDPPELIILDYRMPAPDGLELCRELKATPRLEHLPVLILTGESQTEDRIEGFDAGADDYLAKPFHPRELVGRVQALLRLTRQGLDRNPTSGLPGGGAIERELERRRQGAEPFAICYFDLDHFKPFGDRFGFRLADEVIRDAGEALTTVADPADFVGHIGGDDFVLICPAGRGRDTVAAARERFRARLAARLPGEVVEAGSYEGVDREGRTRSFPLTRLAAAIVVLHPGWSGSLDDLGAVVAEAKKKAKLEEAGIAEVELDADDRGQGAPG